MNAILNRDILNVISEFLNNDDLFFYVQTCRDFRDSVNKKIYLPYMSFIFSNVKYLEWIDEFKDFKTNKLYMFKLGIMHGNCDVLDYIKYKIGDKYFSSDLYEEACYVPYSIDKLNWLKKNRCNYSENTKYSLSFDIPLTSKIHRWINDELIFDEDKFYYFLKYNIYDYDSIDWILKSIPRLKEDFCEIAVSLNNIELLNWGIENDCSLSIHCCSRAASIGNLDLLKFLKRNYCPWNCWTNTEAAANGHLDILKWAYSKGCPLEAFALVDAIDNKHVDIVRWLLENDCPIDDLVIEMYKKTNDAGIKMCKFFK